MVYRLQLVEMIYWVKYDINKISSFALLKICFPSRKPRTKNPQLSIVHYQLLLTPFQCPLSMRIQKPDKQYKEENQHFNQCKPSNRFSHYRPWIEENEFYIKNQEDQCEKIIAHIQLRPCFSLSWNAAFIGLLFLSVGGAFDDYFRYQYGYDGKSQCSQYQYNHGSSAHKTIFCNKLVTCTS